MAEELGLIIIYNHKYVKNIDILEKIYKGRFSNIYHIVPFYDGDKANVIAVYESSYYFQGYIAQAFKSFFEERFKHYFFIADDMIINPLINENNYREIFKLDDASGFISELDPMPGKNWPHNRAAVMYDPYKAGVEIKNEIPAKEDAKKMIESLNVQNGKYSIKEIYFAGHGLNIKKLALQTIKYLYDRYVMKTDYSGSSYPFVRAYSDIFIISAKNVKKFIHYCGAFAATDLWVEVAIPTALVLCGENIVTQDKLNLQGRPLWSAEDYKLLDTFNYNLKNLLDNFPENYIYLHPIKLSKWKVEI